MMTKSDKYYKELMSHRYISRRGLFQVFVNAVRPVSTPTLPVHTLPPGALPDIQFRAQCTQCDLCIQVCPMGIIKRHEDGYPQLMIEFASCDGCGLCIAACSSEALLPQSRFDTGLRPVFNADCVNPVRNCKQCVDSCQHQACVIHETGIPVVNTVICNGCGECLVQCNYDAVKLEMLYK